MNKLTLLFILISCLVTTESKASHIVGGEVYYDSLGNNMFRVTFELFRDCQNSTTPFDDPLEYSIFLTDGTLYWTRSVFAPTTTILPIVYDDPCVTPPNDICIERAIYIDTITLPFNPQGYVISYQRCCWANNIQNILNPGDNGITVSTFVPGTSLVDIENQAARFNLYPPLVLCANNTLEFDHSATDPDGDSLVYLLCSPLSGGSIVDVMPNPEAPPPYFPVSWETGFSASVPLGPGSDVTIDSETGFMSFTPSAIGNYAISVCVQEYRDGIMINEKMRTFGYRVVTCDVEVPLTVEVVGPPELIEDCGFTGFIVSRSTADEELEVQISLGGTAENGLDYAFLPDSLILGVGVFTDTIGFTPLYDGITEGMESVIFNIVIENPCENTFDTTSTTVNIIDYIPMTISGIDSLNVCSGFGESAEIFCNVQNGVGPFSFVWTPNNGYPSNDTITVLPSHLEPNLNLFSVTVTDQCEKEISLQGIAIYDQCPLTVPNVITFNGDGVNDQLIIENLEDFDAVQLQIFNRWGNLIYTNENYQNNWAGEDLNGKAISEGVYFYVVTPDSGKYVYDDQQETQYSLHGFFHVIK
jgi:gliding motility-associated-like protein